MFFFGNYFYGLCAIILSIEATLQQRFPLNGVLYFLLVFSCTVAYYNQAYITTEIPARLANQRSAWYVRNKIMVVRTRRFFLVLTLANLSLYTAWNLSALLRLRFYEWLIIFIFPLVSLMYYGVRVKQRQHNLRNIGWLKPFIIGFTWAGLVNVYPVLYCNIEQGLHYKISFVSALLFIKNFMFVTVLCIIFDIKDYAMDYNQQLKTFVVNVGLRKTIFFIIIPLASLGLASFLYFARLQHFLPGKIVLNAIPFLLLLLIAYSLQTRRSIFYYLVIIDGLMLLKGVCGTLAMLYF